MLGSYCISGSTYRLGYDRSHYDSLRVEELSLEGSVFISELIATCTVGCDVAWSRQFLQELSFAQLTIQIGVDNKCSMRLLEQGARSFKRAKHIKVRFFWLKDLS